MKRYFQRPLFANIYLLELILLAAGSLFFIKLIIPLVQLDFYNFDVLLYIDTALFPDDLQFIMNRYMHIYLQKFFLEIISPSLRAVEIFWAFQIFGTACLVYINAKLLSSKNNFVHGIIAVLFFFVNREIFLRAGTPVADFTVMLWLALGITIYLLYERYQTKDPLFLIPLGMLQYFAFKSKESGIVLIFVLLGALFIGQFSWRILLKRILWIGVGVLLGVFFMATLNYFILGEFFFGLRLSDFERLSSFVTNPKYSSREGETWYFYIFNSQLLLPFIFGLLAFARDEEKFNFAKRVLWLLPIGIILFLSVASTSAAFPMRFRYMYPVFAIIPLLGAQYFSFNLQKSWKKLLGLVAAGGLFVLVLHIWIYPYFLDLPLAWRTWTFHPTVIISLGLSGIFILYIYKKWIPIPHAMASIPFIILVMYFPYYYLSAELNNVMEISNVAIEPFVQYYDYLDIQSDSQIFLSDKPYKNYIHLGRSDGSMRRMINIYYDIRMRNDNQITFSDDLNLLFDNDYDYGFMTVDEWEVFNQEIDLEQFPYEIIIANKTDVVLLIGK